MSTIEDENVSNTQDNISFQESLKKCEQVLNKFNIDRNRMKRSWNKEIQDELKNVRKQVEQSISESKESLKINEHNDHELKELLENCLKNTTEWLKTIQKIIKCIMRRKNCSSNSSVSSENDTEQLLLKARRIKKKLNELTKYMINTN